jgi:hypothetical protein
MSDKEKLAAAVGLITFGVTFIVAIPLISMWGWNHLFGDIKTIEYSFSNWFAVVALGMFFRGVNFSKNKDK